MNVHEMRRRCLCGETNGYIERRATQDCVFCTHCQRFQYNAPRHETGLDVQSLRSRHDISPSQRARILERDGRCIACGSDRDLQIAHLISVADGHAEGLTDRELYSDENLAAMCAECNSGWGRRTVSVRLMAKALRIRAKASPR